MYKVKNKMHVGITLMIYHISTKPWMIRGRASYA